MTTRWKPFSVLMIVCVAIGSATSVAKDEDTAARPTLRLEQAGFLGGSGEDRAHGMATDRQGNVYLTAPIGSVDFPMTADALNTTPTGIYFAILSPTGALRYSTYLGAAGGINYVHGVALDQEGNIYIAGNTTNASFPTTPGAYQVTFRGPRDGHHGDAFVIKLSPGGKQIIYATFLGGSGRDICGRIEVDREGNAYILGSTSSSDFPVTAGAYQAGFRGGEAEPTGRGDLFVAKLSADGRRLLYSTYIGGSGMDIYGGNIVVDNTGGAWFSGTTTSSDFPVTASAFQRSYRGGSGSRAGGDGVVVHVNPSGTGLEYASYIGGRGDDNARSLTLDAEGNVWVSGDTTSDDFPTTPDAYMRGLRGGTDCFFLKLDTRRGSLEYASLFGGARSDSFATIGAHASGRLVLMGQTESADFPVSPGGGPTSLRGSTDVFVTLLDRTGRSIESSALLGGSGGEVPGPLLLINNSVYVAGNTTSSDFPTTPEAGDTTYNGGTDAWGGDAFVARFSVDGTNQAASRVPSGEDRKVLTGDYLGQPLPGATPEVFATGIVSTGANEHSAPSFSPDGNEVFWWANQPPGPGEKDWTFFSMTMRRENGRWSPPGATPFASVMPAFSPDGRRVYYGSQEDIWVVEKRGNGWGEPRCLDFVKRFPELRHADMPRAAANGTLYFLAYTPGPRNDFGIFRSEFVNGEYAKPELLPRSINLPGSFNWAPFIAPDESYLLYSSGRPGSLDTVGDIYISRRLADGSWTDPVSLGEPVNTPRQEVFPGVSPDGKYLFFCRSTPGRRNEVYWVDAASIPALRPVDTSSREPRK